ncbi:bifunctional glycosyltransferase/CDP-glycerol:glycerophosphate glycerophosphotransferase [Streptomyces sp. NBC_00525]|uniref:bifunctional glycosyltransferase/CDP-glycerol:glycerophosphate glycerophosphotransferase n=1 Tax=Streptomyces sp. NBC_00525 TaxID=2903660 RepID=UPI002E816048|nr:bifunctional glycosyltransferase family 2 protein/CDP-glycerol:glycerophosphate glycerophosphotransferase [Streptomyces sp. NBC_00525]WUC93928.1 bifunctional glycosyltransferase family 2 protein/CDP-glycerol:glycerophosphate glycerophosphotransferase [Streptomyces sp. NBC_00525]
MLNMPPRLSVVVPVYNVELFLTDCLKSLAEQTMTDLEVVMVDDGSTDGSAALAEEFAAGDDRFKLVRQKNGGLGHARNTGFRNCHPESRYLAFCDSDDIIPPNAYELLVESLEETGSDLASGNVLRLRAGGKLVQSPMFRKPMATTRKRTHVSRDLDLLGDRIACNKVFRRSFWDKNEFAFPVGALYEDIPVVLPAHFLADAVDIVKDPVYYWRDRPGSITTSRAVVRGIHDRVAHVQGVSEFLAAKRTAADKNHYEAHALANDLWYFMEVLPDGDQEYRDAFLTYTNKFIDQVDPAVLDGLPLRLRVMWYLVREHRMDELLALLLREKSEPGAFEVSGVRRRQAHYPVLTRPVPAPVLRVADRDLPLAARLRDAQWRDGKLFLKGYAYVRNLPVTSGPSEFRLGWLRAGRRNVVPLRLRRVDEPEATARSRQSLHDYHRSGFETSVDAAKLRIQADSGPKQLTWQFEVGIARNGLLRRAFPSVREASVAPPVHRPDGDHRIVPAFDGDKLVLHAERVDARFETHAGDKPGTVTVSGVVRTRLVKGELTLRLTHGGTRTTFEVPATVGSGAGAGWSRFTAELPLATVEENRPAGEDAPKSVSYSIHLVGKGLKASLDVPGSVHPGRYPLAGGPDGARRELALVTSSRGNLVIGDRPVQPAVELASWTEDGRLFLEGNYPEDPEHPVELVAQNSGHREEQVFPVEFTGPEGARRFRAELRPDAVEGPGGALPLGEGNWYFFFRDKGAADESGDRALRIPASAFHTLPAARRLRGRDYTLERRFGDQLLVVSGSVLTAAERGPRAKRLLSEAYAAQRSEQLRAAALYSTFDGRQYSDSPRAVYEELVRRGTEVEHIWVVRDQQAIIPEGATVVEHGSVAWHEALARSRYIVTNTQLPEWFARREDQTVVQTWHGTPLKRIGLELAGTAQANAAYIATLADRAKQWNFLVSPNTYSTPVLRRSFGFEGEVLECGYPRNDIFHAPDRAKVAAAVREKLGIPAGKRVVLYAPTWREDQRLGGGRYSLGLQLDLAAAERELGEDTVLLVRRHYMVTDRLPDSGTGFVKDVSRYPDVGELMLISDALVTDYSSLMFDFAQTGRPMLFHTYDLEHYRDTLRGFSFDFESRAPGPLIPASDDLIAALRDPEKAIAGHAKAYEQFRHDFCDLDDGRATARVVDRML